MRIKVFYENWLAKAILFKNYGTMMFFGFIITKHASLPIEAQREERIHQLQFKECMEIATIPAVFLSLYVSWWWMLLIPTLYYIMYGVEWFISFVYHLFKDKQIGDGKVNANAYYASAFEMEAKENRNSQIYLRFRKWGGLVQILREVIGAFAILRSISYICISNLNHYAGQIKNGPEVR